MELENFLKGLRAAAASGITAEHLALNAKRFFHLVWSHAAFTFLILVFHDQYSRIKDLATAGNKRDRESVLQLMM